MKRTVTGLVLLSLLLGFVLLTKVSQFFFDAILLFFMGFSLYEMVKLGKERGYQITVIPLAIMFAALYPMIYFFGYKGYLTVAGAGFLLLFVFYIFTQKMEFKDFLYNVFIAIYPMLLLSLAFCMIYTPYGEQTVGMLPLLIAAGAAMMADTFAFYFGSLIKGPKIFPKISPKKTYAGCIAGLFGGAAGAMVVYGLFEAAGLPLYMPLSFANYLAHPILFYCFVGAGIAVVSELGDLGASRIKRSLEIKDFSTALGSHGGVMDRLDSILFAIVFMAVLLGFLL